MADEFKQVTFTHQSADAYATVELVGDYLFAARIINRKLMPSRDQIGVLVDYGCGAGKSTRAVACCAREGGKVVGVDVSTAMLDHARALTKKAASNLPTVSFEFLQIVDDSIPLPRASADAVMTCAVLQEIQTEEQLGAILTEIGRILKPGGQFVAIVPNEHLRLEDFVSVTFAPFPENATRQDNIRKNRSTEAPIVWEKDRLWSKEVYASLVVKAGMEVVSLEYPLAHPSEPPYPDKPEILWKDELRIAPALVIHALKQ
jgi:SAM-dependent methyltransferase